MKAEPYFGLRLKFLQTEYEPLTKLVIFKPGYDYTTKEYLWVFPYSKIKEVEAIVGTIEIPGLREGFKKEEVAVPQFKGKDFVEIVEYPKIYQIVEHRKQEDGSVKELKHNLDKEIVNKVWKEVIAIQPLNKPIKTATVAEKICKALGITRFNRASGSFQFDKFFGSRKDYYQFFYLVMKVLVHLGKIKHYKDGKIERLK